MNKQVNEQQQRRNFVGQLSLRADDNNSESRTIEGVACKMGVAYDMGWYKEVVSIGAFDSALKNSDIRCLVDHDPSKLLGRTSSGTCEVWIDGDELRYKVPDMPNNSVGNDTLESIRRKDLKESSFGFTIKRGRWETIEDEGKDWEDWERTYYIEEVGIVYDVSPVTFPANPDTSVMKRSFEAYRKQARPAEVEETPSLEFYKRRFNIMKKTV